MREIMMCRVGDREVWLDAQCGYFGRERRSGAPAVLADFNSYDEGLVWAAEPPRPQRPPALLSLVVSRKA